MKEKLQIEHIEKKFGNRIILQDINITVQEGEFVSIVGPSGCGKTTLLRIIDGLIAPSDGCVKIDGKVEEKPGINRGFVFQGDSLMPWYNVRQNIEIGLEIQGVPEDKRNMISSDLINKIGLSSFENHYPRQLSGGMRQRVNLARALAISPDILLMDEPFSALDAQTRELMQDELLSMWNRFKKTVVFITHQIDEAVYLSDRVIVLGTFPGRVKMNVPIELSRPRSLSVKRERQFLSYVDQIWKAIEEEARKSLDGR